MGILGNLTNMVIPTPYKILGGILAAALLFGGIYYYGYHRAEKVTAAKYELKIANFEIAAAKLNTDLTKERENIKERVVTKYQTVVQTVEKERIVYRDAAAQDVPAQNRLSKGWVYLHDQAALGNPVDESKVKDPTPSGVMDNQAIGVVSDNYAVCRENSAELKALQDYNRQLMDYTTSLKKQLENANRSLLKR